MRRTVLPVIAAAALALGRCSSDAVEPEPAVTQQTAAAPTTASSEPTGTASAATQAAEPGPTTEVPGDGPTDETDAPADAELSTEEQRSPERPSSSGTGTGGDLFPTGARVASHDGYERVVVDFDGTGTPGWSVQYVEEAIADDSGRVVDLDGERILRIDVSGVTVPLADGEPDVSQVASGHYDVGQAELVQDVYVSGTFEGWSGALIGLDEQAPFRVSRSPIAAGSWWTSARGDHDGRATTHRPSSAGPTSCSRLAHRRGSVQGSLGPQRRRRGGSLEVGEQLAVGWVDVTGGVGEHDRHDVPELVRAPVHRGKVGLDGRTHRTRAAGRGDDRLGTPVVEILRLRGLPDDLP